MTGTAVIVPATERGDVHRPQAVIVGGGPAGCSAALGLLRAGWRVRLFEQRDRWPGRVCGAFLNAEAVAHLRWLGLEEAVRSQAAPVASARVCLSGRETSVPLEPGLALPRETFEDILLGAVSRAGGDVTAGRRARPDEIRADMVVRADGRFSAEPPAKTGGWFGWNAAFRGAAAAPGDLSLHFRPGGYVGVVTFPDGTSNVCGLLHRAGGSAASWEDVFNEHISRLPSLRSLLRGAERATEWRGVGPLPFSWRMRGSDGLPVGDAAAVGDPYMGEGIARALGAGPMLAEAMDAPPRRAEARYRALWNGRYRSRLLFGGAARSMLRRPLLLRAASALFLSRPQSLNALTALFHGQRFPSDPVPQTGAKAGADGKPGRLLAAP